MVTSWSRRNSEKKSPSPRPSIHPPIGKSGWVVEKTCTCISRCFKLFFQTKIRSFGETSTCKAFPIGLNIWKSTTVDPQPRSLARLTAIPCRTAAPSFSQMTRRCPSFAWNAGCVVFFAKALVGGIWWCLRCCDSSKMLWDFGLLSFCAVVSIAGKCFETWSVEAFKLQLAALLFSSVGYMVFPGFFPWDLGQLLDGKKTKYDPWAKNLGKLLTIIP